MGVDSTRPAFTYGRPVRPDEFVGRGAELRTIFNRVRNGESTAVVGGPKVGKSSLLIKLADAQTQREYLGRDAPQVLTCALDLHALAAGDGPRAFWQDALAPLHAAALESGARQQLDRAVESGYARRPLERFFNALGRHGQRLVLVLDEFERLLSHDRFQDPSFFALLRSLATRTNGLALVIASRLSVADINERGRDLLNVGSPFFNIMINLRLRALDAGAADALLARAGSALSVQDRRFVCRASGCQPFLLQALAATLIYVSADLRGADRAAEAASTFVERVGFHFADQWDALTPLSRAAVTLLCLSAVCAPDLACGDLMAQEAFSAQLQALHDLDLAVKVGPDWAYERRGLCHWRGETWTIGAQAFAWWVLNGLPGAAPRFHSLGSDSGQAAHADGLFDLFGNEAMGRLMDCARESPALARPDIGPWARTLYETLAEAGRA